MQICSSLVIVSRYSRMQEAYFYVKALPTRCLIISGIEKGIQSGLAAGTLTVALIWASWLLRYGKECTHASHSKPYCDTGLPAVAYRSADQLLLVVGEEFLQRKKNSVDPWPELLWEALESRAYCRADVTKASIALIQFLDADDGNSSRARWTGRSFFKPRMAVRA